MSEYVHRLIPDHYDILGLSLKPFSIGHALRMQKEGCAFIQEDAQATANDLLLGLCICSRTYKEFDEFNEDDESSAAWCIKWGNAVMEMADHEASQDKGVSISDQWKRLHYYNQLIRRESKRFMAYMKQGIKEPYAVKEQESNNWVSATPANPYQNLRHLLITELGYNAESVMDVPLSSAIADYYKYAETQGQITIISW